MSYETKSEVLQTEEVVWLLRRLRHRYMKLFQIAYGWLQVGEPERALEYLATSRRQLEGESALMRSVPAPFALAMTHLAMKLEESGLTMAYDFADLAGVDSDEYPGELQQLQFGRVLGEMVQFLASNLSAGVNGNDVEVTLVPPALSDNTIWELHFRGPIADNKSVGKAQDVEEDSTFEQLAYSFENMGYRVPFFDTQNNSWSLDIGFHREV